MNKTAAFYQSPIGKIFIDYTDDIIVSVLFEKQNDQQGTFKIIAGRSGQQPGQPEIVSNEPALPHALLNKCLLQLHEYFEGNRKEFDLPVHQNGTAFQQKIWSALTQIPYGKTMSYLELSKRTGDAKAIRAVGTTNGKNQLSIVVPCHRVIGSNGSLTGYGGGLWRKQWLLEHEARFAHGVQTLF